MFLVFFPINSNPTYYSVKRWFNAPIVETGYFMVFCNMAVFGLAILRKTDSYFFVTCHVYIYIYVDLRESN